MASHLGRSRIVSCLHGNIFAFIEVIGYIENGFTLGQVENSFTLAWRHFCIHRCHRLCREWFHTWVVTFFAFTNIMGHIEDTFTLGQTHFAFTNVCFDHFLVVYSLFFFKYCLLFNDLFVFSPLAHASSRGLLKNMKREIVYFTLSHVNSYSHYLFFHLVRGCSYGVLVTRCYPHQLSYHEL